MKSSKEFIDAVSRPIIASKQLAKTLDVDRRFSLQNGELFYLQALPSFRNLTRAAKLRNRLHCDYRARCTGPAKQMDLPAH
jgi:hypothetical protein